MRSMEVSVNIKERKQMQMADELGTEKKLETAMDAFVASIKTGNSASFAAEATGVGISTIYREMNKGNIPVIKIGERRTIPGWWILDQISRPDTDAAA